MSQWIIIYPRGDRSRISTAQICEGMEYEIKEYALASRQRFYSEQEANEYAIQLASEFGRTPEIDGHHDYLD